MQIYSTYIFTPSLKKFVTKHCCTKRFLHFSSPDVILLQNMHSISKLMKGNQKNQRIKQIVREKGTGRVYDLYTS